MPAPLMRTFFKEVLLPVPALALPRSGSAGRRRSRPPSQPGLPKLPQWTKDIL